MKAVIIEDEKLSAQYLAKIVLEKLSEISIEAILPSVNRANEWIKANQRPDLVFLDIQLNDGTGFDILDQWPDHPPVIFTTAYDEHAIKGFKYNSIDYLLKPIVPKELVSAFQKLKSSTEKKETSIPVKELKRWMQRDFKKRFMIKVGDQFQVVEVGETAYFFSIEGMTFLIGKSGQKWPIDFTLDQLEDLINPAEFFRVNRKFIVSISGVKHIHSYFNSRLLLQLNPEIKEEVIVSRDRVAAFKQWVDM